MKEFIVLNPAGNITALVLDETVKREDYKNVSREILEFNKSIEQVGFLKRLIIDDKTIFRLEMMGMEFCGNASRAFGCFLSYKGLEENNTFLISVSGINIPISVSVKCIKDKEYFSSIEIPVNKNRNEVLETKNIDNIEVNIVTLDGITHVLIDEDLMKFDETKYLEYAKYFIKQLNLRNLSAVGIIWYNKFKIKPVVWVRDTDTYYYENACGSGSLALGLYYALNKNIKNVDVIQKNNEIITIVVDCNNNHISNASIQGNTTICD